MGYNITAFHDENYFDSVNLYSKAYGKALGKRIINDQIKLSDLSDQIFHIKGGLSVEYSFLGDAFNQKLAVHNVGIKVYSKLPFVYLSKRNFTNDDFYFHTRNSKLGKPHIYYFPANLSEITDDRGNWELSITADDTAVINIEPNYNASNDTLVIKGTFEEINTARGRLTPIYPMKLQIEPASRVLTCYGNFKELRIKNHLPGNILVNENNLKTFVMENISVDTEGVINIIPTPYLEYIDFRNVKSASSNVFLYYGCVDKLDQSDRIFPAYKKHVGLFNWEYPADHITFYSSDFKIIDLRAHKIHKLNSQQFYFVKCNILEKIVFANNTDLTDVNFIGYATNFAECTSLTRIQCVDESIDLKGINNSINLGDCPLDEYTTKMISRALAEVTTATTITFKTSSYNYLTPEEIAAVEAKGWTIKTKD